MADPLLPMTLGVGASLVKVLLQAKGYVTEANFVEVVKEGCDILSRWKNQGSNAGDQLAKQIAEILAEKTHDMYEECRGRGIDKERLEGVITEVKILLDQVITNDKLLLAAVNDSDNFYNLLRKRALPRRAHVESRVEVYFDALVKAVADEYVKLAPWSPKFQIEALKDLINKVDEILKNTAKGLENDEIIIAEIDDVKKDVNDVPGKVVAEIESKFLISAKGPVIFGRRPDVVGPYYIEREEQVLLRNLINEDPRLRVVLVGMRGCGKSQLASELARWCGEEKWRLVAWINATSKEQVRSGLIELAGRLGIETQGRNEEWIIEQCFSHLESGEPGDRLIVFDNVEDINHLTKLVPRGDGLRVVVTTTNENGWKNQSWESIKIGVFSREDSIKCLLRITDSKDLEAADAVAQKLGDLPLAIAQAGATACAEHFTLNEYLTCLDDYSSRDGYGNNEIIRSIDGDSYTDGAFDALFMAVNVALNKLGDSLYEVGRRQLGGLALLAQSGVPTRWIAPLPDDNRRALTRLVNMSVVQQSADDGKSLTMLHRLQAQVLRENWGEGNTATREEAFDAAVEILGRTKYEQSPSNDTDARRREVNDLITQFSAIATQDYSYFLFSCKQIRNYLRSVFKDANNLGLAHEAVELVATEKVIEDILGPDHFEMLRIRNDIANIYNAVGCFDKAISLYMRVADDCEETLGSDHPATLTVRNNLAGAYLSVGCFKEAIKSFKKVVAGRKKELGLDHPTTMMVYNNLFFAYKSDGRLDDAIDLYRRLLDDCEETLGSDHPATLTVRNNLAGAYLSVGCFKEAIKSFKKVVADRKKELGLDHPTTMMTRNNLASAYHSAGHFDEAINVWEELLPDCQRVLRLEHPLTKQVEKNLEAAKREMNPPDAPSPETGED